MLKQVGRIYLTRVNEKNSLHMRLFTIQVAIRYGLIYVV